MLGLAWWNYRVWMQSLSKMRRAESIETFDSPSMKITVSEIYERGSVYTFAFFISFKAIKQFWTWLTSWNPILRIRWGAIVVRDILTTKSMLKLNTLNTRSRASFSFASIRCGPPEGDDTSVIHTMICSCNSQMRLKQEFLILYVMKANICAEFSH